MRNNVNTLVNKVVFALAVTLVVTVTLSSCRSKKALVKEDKTVAVPSQTAGSQSDKNNKEQQRQLLQQQFVKKVADNAVYNKCITSKIDFNLNLKFKLKPKILFNLKYNFNLTFNLKYNLKIIQTF